MVRIKLFSILAELAGKREIEIKIDNKLTVKEILPLIFSETNEKFKKFIYDEKNNFLKEFINIVLNEKILRKEEINNVLLKNEDILALLTPIEGG